MTTAKKTAVLLVEADTPIRNGIVTYLRKDATREVEGAADLRRAIARMKRNGCDVLVAQVATAEVPQFLEELQRRVQQVPAVILVTEKASPFVDELVERQYASIVHAMVHRPIHLRELTALVANAGAAASSAASS